MIPVSPPNVNKKINPKAHIKQGVNIKMDPWRVANHLKTLIPTGTAMTIITVVK